MFIVRLVVLGLLVALGWGFGTIPAHELNGFGQFMAGSFLLTGPVLYFYPMYEAYIHKQPNFYSIFALNLLLGWTLVGWVVALVWALKVHPGSVDYQPEVVKTIPDTHPTPQPSQQPSISSSAKQTVECPFCAEEILAKAKKCKHCGSDVVPKEV